jgi:vacuolar protein sorting-associated protein VTA1
VKTFFTAGVIYDCLLTFGELTDEVQQNRKYAKWKAAYIHNCLKNGETPVPGPMKTDDDEDLEGQEGANEPGPSTQPPPTMGFLPYNPATPSDHTDPFQNVQLPIPPKEPEKPPGGFVPYHPPQEPEVTYTPPSAGVNLSK